MRPAARRQATRYVRAGPLDNPMQESGCSAMVTQGGVAMPTSRPRPESRSAAPRGSSSRPSRARCSSTGSPAPLRQQAQQFTALGPSATEAALQGCVLQQGWLVCVRHSSMDHHAGFHCNCEKQLALERSTALMGDAPSARSSPSMALFVATGSQRSTMLFSLRCEMIESWTHPPPQAVTRWQPMGH